MLQGCGSITDRPAFAVQLHSKAPHGGGALLSEELNRVPHGMLMTEASNLSADPFAFIQSGPQRYASPVGRRQFPPSVLTAGGKRIVFAGSGWQVGRSEGVAIQFVQHLLHRRVIDDRSAVRLAGGDDPDQMLVVGNDWTAGVAVVDAIELGRVGGTDVLITWPPNPRREREALPHASDARAPTACAELPVRRVRPSDNRKSRFPPGAGHENLVVRPGNVGLDRIAERRAAVRGAVQRRWTRLG
ncbi:hypothetical protein XFF6990_160044 [Xanthomonas citri pv. fuscans]|nr:hypothetical protein XFF6990_160044 [Xanthomonas citri pv. fuscans]